ncbi:HNH endonuclease [Emticicia soli]|uniref:HNH endonuclease n=1 Tax=Emticicia soli TaxID=2027878 RepID=A0ABW5J5W0_9BACT
MIKLERNFTPIILTPSFVEQKTQEFKSKKNRVWDIPLLKKALLELSSEKCAYCECNIMEESKYMEVEHFEDKDRYPDKVLSWENLLPSCKRCNGIKSTHDVINEPIINPFINNPSEHLAFRLYNFSEKSMLGETTIETLDLNNMTRVVNKRFKVGQELIKLIARTLIFSENYVNKKSTRNKNTLISTITDILEQCLPYSQYSATLSTILHSDKNYLKIKKIMQENSLWTEEINQLDIDSQKIKLDIV